MVHIYSGEERRIHYKLFKKVIKGMEKSEIDSIGFVGFDCFGSHEEDNPYVKINVILYKSNGTIDKSHYFLSLKFITHGFKATPKQLKKYRG